MGEVGASSRDPSRESAGVSFFHFNLYSMGRGFSKSLAEDAFVLCRLPDSSRSTGTRAAVQGGTRQLAKQASN